MKNKKVIATVAVGLVLGVLATGVVAGLPAGAESPAMEARITAWGGARRNPC